MQAECAGDDRRRKKRYERNKKKRDSGYQSEKLIFVPERRMEKRDGARVVRVIMRHKRVHEAAAGLQRLVALERSTCLVDLADHDARAEADHAGGRRRTAEKQREQGGQAG